MKIDDGRPATSHFQDTASIVTSSRHSSQTTQWQRATREQDTKKTIDRTHMVEIFEDQLFAQ